MDNYLNWLELFLSFASLKSKSSKMRDSSKTLVKVSIRPIGIQEPIRVREPIWNPTWVIGTGLILTLCLSCFAVYSDCWEKGITQTKLCQRRGIDGHFIPIPVVIGLWYRYTKKFSNIKIFEN